ncbi:glycosyltransferase [Clostridium sp. JN-1]|uniref:glycosyltransferase n=1 Tax=Clostridium sp. JN-1 TaxID=2483110 RepID=UPI000F0AFF45|nr:glycosyltransferase [Clostridium sp. JN-1]
MKKIVYVVEAFGSGVYSFLTELTSGLTNDYDIVIIYSLRKETPANFEKDFNPKIKFVKIDMCRGLNPYKNIKSLFQLRKMLKFEDPDIIHLHSSKAGFLGRIASYINGFDMNKVIYNPHGFSFLQKDKSSLKKKFFYRLEKFAAKFGGCIVGCSQSEYKEALKLSSNCININNGIDTSKIDKLLNQVNLESPNEKTNKSRAIIGTVGRICRQKNPELFNKIAESFPNYNFVWIGDGELKDKLTSPNISIIGWIERKQVLKKLLSFDIYIMTSLWEGLPISLLEAMYLYKTVIVSNVIGNKDVVKNYENGFISNDLNEFLNYINMILNDDDLKNKLSDNANKTIDKYFNIKIMISKYKELYNTLKS